MQRYFRFVISCLLSLSFQTLLANTDSLSMKERIEALKKNSLLDYRLTELVKQKITYFSTKGKSFTSRAKTWGPLYFPFIEQELAKNGIPVEFKYIAVLESGLNPFAGSEKGPYGLWQFTHATAQVLGMKMNENVDDRRDLELSTKAACAYFIKLHALYNDWLLALCAYNCGSGNVDKAISASGGKKNYWEIRSFLPAFTKEYIPTFMAFCYVMSLNENTSFTPSKFIASELDTLTVNKTVYFDKAAIKLNLNVNDLALLNARYKKQKIVVAQGQTIPFVLPKGKAAEFLKE